jgi:FkbM family methyltransferase
MVPALSERAGMNFDDMLIAYAPRVWFLARFVKYKYLNRGELELALVRHLVEPGTTAVDVGASIGLYAQEMSLHAGKVVAFEANPKVAAFARSVLPRKVEVINAALSSASGRVTLKVPRDASGHAITEAATIAEANPLHAADAEAVEVPMHRLDDFAIESASFVKIDTEGHEEDVLEGAAGLIARERPVLMAELNEAFGAGVVARVATRFAAMSYGAYFLSQGRLRPAAQFDPARYQDASLLVVPRRMFPEGREFISNFIFIPDEKRARIMTRLGKYAA